MTTIRAFRLDDTYVSIEDDGQANPIHAGPDFWPDLFAGKRTVGRWLLGGGERAEDSPNWDMHPNGECILILLNGRIDVGIREDDGETRIELHPGEACVIPRGVWHRQIVLETSYRIFLVAGDGTEMQVVS